MWGYIFEECDRRYLIDMPDDYINEELCYSNEKELEEIFTKKEEENLFSITLLQ